jgi:hypothetical protein
MSAARELVTMTSREARFGASRSKRSRMVEDSLPNVTGTGEPRTTQPKSVMPRRMSAASPVSTLSIVTDSSRSADSISARWSSWRSMMRIDEVIVVPAPSLAC